MASDLNDLTLAFSLWEQARKELLAVEQRIVELRASGGPVPPGESDELDARHAALRARVDRLLAQAIDALREHNASGYRGT